jgi:tetratricopeptide (TPR) repeat protein
MERHFISSPAARRAFQPAWGLPAIGALIASLGAAAQSGDPAARDTDPAGKKPPAVEQAGRVDPSPAGLRQLPRPPIEQRREARELLFRAGRLRGEAENPETPAERRAEARKEAEAAFLELMRRYDGTRDAARAQIFLVGLYKFEGQLEKAIEVGTDLARRYPGTEYEVAAYQAIASIYSVRLKNPDEAARWLEKAKKAADGGKPGPVTDEQYSQTDVSYLSAELQLVSLDAEAGREIEARRRIEALVARYPQYKSSIEDQGASLLRIAADKRFQEPMKPDRAVPAQPGNGAAPPSTLPAQEKALSLKPSSPTPTDGLTMQKPPAGEVVVQGSARLLPSVPREARRAEPAAIQTPRRSPDMVNSRGEVREPRPPSATPEGLPDTPAIQDTAQVRPPDASIPQPAPVAVSRATDEPWLIGLLIASAILIVIAFGVSLVKPAARKERLR